MKKILFLLLGVCCFTLTAQNEALFEKANKAYNEGEYASAIEQYEKILENKQHSAELYYNLGNAHYKLNQIAPSIYNYEKALLLKPNDPEISRNLGYANNMTLDAVDNLPEVGLAKIYNNLINWLSFDQWAYLAVSCIILFVLFYLAFYFFNNATKKRISFILSILFLFVSISAGALAYLNFQKFNNDQPAIVFADEVKVISEPNERGQEVFILHEGTKVNIQDNLNDHFKIMLTDGKSGWLPKTSIKRLKDF